MAKHDHVQVAAEVRQVLDGVIRPNPPAGIGMGSSNNIAREYSGEHLVNLHLELFQANGK